MILVPLLNEVHHGLTCNTVTPLLWCASEQKILASGQLNI